MIRRELLALFLRLKYFLSSSQCEGLELGHEKGYIHKFGGGYWGYSRWVVLGFLD